MNWDQIENGWKQDKGDVNDRWGDLTDDQLASRIQATFVNSYVEAEPDLTEWQQHVREIKRPR
jgi:hypothetical protein